MKLNTWRHYNFIKMQTSLHIIAIFLVLQPFAVATTPDAKLSPETSTESAKVRINAAEKALLENSILSLLGLSKRPKPIDRSKIVVPDTMKQLYDDLMNDDEKRPPNFPEPNYYTRKANTVRSFAHAGKINGNIFFTNLNG